MVNDFEEMLTEFSRISKQIKKDSTFLEISGYPHYENVCSNILAFFFDPLKEHGLSDLLLRSLFQCLNESYKLFDSSNVTVEREVGAGAARIDLIIDSGSHVIAIENKIYHNPDNNPFEAYAEKVDKLAQGKYKIKVLLSLDEKSKSSPGPAGFLTINYPQLFGNIRLNLGDYVTDANNKYLVLFFDFIRSIENLYGGSHMDNELVEFFRNHKGTAQNFYSTFNSYRAELRRMVSEIKSLMTIDEQEGMILLKLYSNAGELYCCLACDLIINDFTVVVDCAIAPDGWLIDISARNQKETSKVDELIKKKKISTTKVINDEYGKKARYQEFGFNEPIKEVHKSYEGVIKQILGN